MISPWSRSQAYYNSGSWRGTWKGEGGGILMNQAPHALDQFIWLGGMAQQVQAYADTRLHDIEVENTAVAILKYGGGKMGWFYTSTAELPIPERIEVAGDKGALVLESNQLRQLTLAQPLSDYARDTTGKLQPPAGRGRMCRWRTPHTAPTKLCGPSLKQCGATIPR